MRSMEAKARWTRKGSAGQSSMVDLEYLICKKTGHAPWLRCLWYERTSPNKPWIGTPTPWMNKIRSSLLPPPRSSWGTAERHSFGNQPRPRAPPPLRTIASNLYKHSRRKKRIVAEALGGDKWIDDIRHNLTTTLVTEFFKVFECLWTTNTILTQGTEDNIHWKWTESGEYSAKSAYQMQFLDGVPSITTNVV